MNANGTVRPGRTLDGRYELLAPHAHGGMATVWAARVRGKHGFEKIVAVKTMHPQLADGPDTLDFRNMFLDEARIASRVRHPNVAVVEDLGEDDGVLYMVIEWVHGDSLGRLRHTIAERGDAPPVDVLLRVMTEACAGLHAAHELRGDDGALLGVVHRDVSPQNILVTDAGVGKVIDFGIAKAVGRLSDHTRTGMIKAKLEYASPEQARSEPCDRRADVWSLGMTLYELLAGVLPFAGRNDAETLRNLTSGRPPPPLPDSVPESVRAIAVRALQPDPAARFQTADEMARALKEATARAVPAEEVAGVLRTYLAARMQERRDKLTQALREADARVGAPPMRGRFPSLPPEIVPTAPVAGAPAMAVDESAASAASARNVIAAPRVRVSHVFWMAALTMLTLAVWAMVVWVLLRGGEMRRAS